MMGQRGSTADPTRIARRLAGGDLRSIGDAERVAADLLRGATLVEEAVGLLSAGDAVLRARSADALEKAARRRPELLRAHKRALLSLMATARQQELRWHVAQMLPLLDLTPRERARARRSLRGYLKDESRIVQVCALQALWDLATDAQRGAGTLRSLVERMAAQGAPAVRARARRLLRERRPRRGA